MALMENYSDDVSDSTEVVPFINGGSIIFHCGADQCNFPGTCSLKACQFIVIDLKIASAMWDPTPFKNLMCFIHELRKPPLKYGYLLWNLQG